MLFDLAADPHEDANLAAARPEDVSAMSAAIERYLAELPRPDSQGPGREVDAETTEALKALGYVE